MKWKLCLLFFLLVLPGCSEGVSAQEKEPPKKDTPSKKPLVYKGKSMDQLFKDWDIGVEDGAVILAFRSFKESGRDDLLQRLKTSTPDAYKAVYLFIYLGINDEKSYQGLLNALDHENTFIVMAAALCFIDLKPEFKKPVAKLEALLLRKDKVLQVSAALALWWHHPRPTKLTKYLNHGLEGGQVLLQTLCLRAIQVIGRAVKGTRPSLLKLLKKDSASHLIKKECLIALGLLGIQKAADVGTVFKLIQKGKLKYDAVLALRKSKALPKNIADTLKTMRIGSNKRLGEASAIALLLSHKDSLEILMQVVEIESSESALSEVASQVIYAAEPDNQQLNLCYLQSSNEEMRLQSIQFFAESEDGSLALPYLINGLADTDESVRDECANAIVEIGGLDKAQYQRLSALLKHPKKSTRKLAQSVLAQLKKSD
ncbi:MAG: hypothetical protein P1V97_21175 [Planctomycetota bacterium]|nr:hypothetical protein [Planctomycetota bacterium]